MLTFQLALWIISIYLLVGFFIPYVLDNDFYETTEAAVRDSGFLKNVGEPKTITRLLVTVCWIPILYLAVSVKIKTKRKLKNKN